ncbi:MAG: exodeoxyribonuclease V subunit gamma [Myxococcales bacterium]
MTFCLYRSNRVEKLAAALSHVVREPLRDAFARECVVVQGPGMERWLSAQLCAELGVWANPWFPFPRAMVELALDAALGEVPLEQRIFRPETLALSIARVLGGEVIEEPAFEEVARYVRRDASSVGTLALASVLATTFDQYLVYRPDLVLGWEHGEGLHFQAKLWRKLTVGAPPTHIARRMAQFHERLARGGALDQAELPLPERISLFGISTLPPAFLQVLARLSERIDVHLFLLTPSPHYWGDFDRKLARGQGVRSLLSNLGRVSREFVDLLLEDLPLEEPYPDLFELRTPSTLLGQLQNDLANLTERDPAVRGELAPLTIAEDDRSISVHACHSPVRELEVLRDVLRARFEADKTLEPHDVVVLAPDIERYAPAIEAVFAQRDGEAREHIPYRIADRSAARSSTVLDAFCALLDLAGSRLSLSEVLDFLHRAPVRERFDLEESELEVLAEWLIDAGARWGIDAAHRTRFGQPEYAQNSLRFALERLLVGYASGAHEQRSVLGVLPYSDVEGEHAVLLGRFARFAETLFATVDACATRRSVAAWAAFWLDTLPRLLSDHAELGHEHHGLRTLLASLAADAGASGYDTEVPLEALRLLLEARFERGRANLGFLTSGVTFCEHVPMRAIPFRVVAMVGMDDEAFPRRAQRPSFDLMAEKRRVGDHDVRDDDRQLFLEALLSARDAVVITYLGRSAKDDSERPASVVVDQLLRVLDRHFDIGDGKKSLLLAFESKRTSEHVSKVHALHRFDARYFGQTSNLPSYDETAATAARALLSSRAVTRPFVRAPFAAAPQERIELERLVSFFRAPQRAFVRERLRVRLPEESEQIPDREPTALDALARFQLHDRLLTGLASKDRDEQQRMLTQEGRLPPGTIGQVLFEELDRTVQNMRAQLDVGAPLPHLNLELRIGGRLLYGRLTGMHEAARVELTAAAASDKHRLSMWIRHLALCASEHPIKHSLLVARADASGKRKVASFRFGPVPDAERLLTELIELYLLGLHMPLPFLRSESSVYAHALLDGHDHERALALARIEGAKPNRFVESAERYVQQVWSEPELEALERLVASDGAQSLDFAGVSRRVLLPMLEHLKEQERP